MTMLDDGYRVGAVLFVALAGLALSNVLYDRGVPSSVSRCTASALGGAAFLLAVYLLDAWTAIALAGAMTLFVVVLRFGFRRGLRGATGPLPSQAWAEVTYALAGTASLAAAWGLAGEKWLAFLPIAFVAWGDNTAGLARTTLWRRNPASVWPSVAMLSVCLAAAALFHSYWIATAGAMAATVAERYRPRVLSVWDDNVNVVVVSLTVMAALLVISK